MTGAALPLRDTDPMGRSTLRIFSAAMFPPAPGQLAPPGYLYVVLDGGDRAAVGGQVSLQRVWRGAALAAGLGLLATLALGGLTFQRLTRPLHRLASHMQAYKLRDGAAATDGTQAASHTQGDEITAPSPAHSRA